MKYMQSFFTHLVFENLSSDKFGEALLSIIK